VDAFLFGSGLFYGDTGGFVAHFLTLALALLVGLQCVELVLEADFFAFDF
jgi:hypothetical protein